MQIGFNSTLLLLPQLEACVAVESLSVSLQVELLGGLRDGPSESHPVPLLAALWGLSLILSWGSWQ